MQAIKIHRSTSPNLAAEGVKCSEYRQNYQPRQLKIYFIIFLNYFNSFFRLKNFVIKFFFCKTGMLCHYATLKLVGEIVRKKTKFAKKLFHGS